MSKLILLSTRNYSTAPNSFYDIVIVGGGLVGSALACLIGQNPWLKQKKVLLLDSGKMRFDITTKSDSNYFNRVSAIRPSSIKLFEKFGIWDHIQARAHIVSGLYVEDGCSGSKIFFNQINKQSPIAYIVENDLILQALHSRLKNYCPNLEYKQEYSFENLCIPENSAENVCLKLNDGKNIECSLLIAADGAKSKVRDIAGIKCNVHNYNQMAIVATLQLSIPPQENIIAFQRFMPLGPVAILPLKKNFCSLVWTTSIAEAKKLLAISKESFLNELNKIMFDTTSYHQNIIGPLDTLTSLFNILPFGTSAKLKFPFVYALDYDNRAAFPLSYVYAKNYIGHRVALIGDAAHRVHPLAGQGVNLGWSDVVNLANTLELTAKEGGDFGSITYLKHYDTESQRKNWPIMTAIDSLNYLFCTSSGPAVFIRSLGFNIFDRFLPIKDLIIRMAS